MKLSIIIVSYNEKQYLSETIESCLTQNIDFEYEIVIGDDGSTDGSIEIIKEYANKYLGKVRYFVMDRKDIKNFIPSVRVSNLLKRGFDISMGEYIVVLSGDDLILDKQRLKKQVVFLNQNKRYESCYTDFKMFWNDGSEKKIEMLISPERHIFWSGYYIHISCFVFRRKCLENLLDRFCDDTGLLFSILVTGKSKHMKIMGFGYRQRDLSIMHEADIIELKLLELSLFQDCVNSGKFCISNMAHFSNVFRYVFKNRKKLKNKKYKKYFDSCKKYNNNYIGKLLHYDVLSTKEKKKTKKMLYKMYLCDYVLKKIRRIENMRWICKLFQ